MAKDKNKTPVVGPGVGSNADDSNNQPPKNQSSDSGTSGSGSSGDSAAARESEYRARAAQSAIDRAENLQKQADALRYALSRKGMKAALKQRLQDVRLDTRIEDRDLVRGYRDRLGSLRNADEDNLKAASAQSYGNLSNAMRERASALSEAMSQGAGESDVLRAQSMALNNWQANQNEVNRAFFDGRTSLNASLTDMTVDTRTARINNVREANAQRDMLWNDYYNRRIEAQTQLGNVYGQMAAEYATANEMDRSKKSRDLEEESSDLSGQAFMSASKTSSKDYENPGVSKKLRKWGGAAPFEGGMDSRQFSRQDVDLAKPEGATLRSWV